MKLRRHRDQFFFAIVELLLIKLGPPSVAAFEQPLFARLECPLRSRTPAQTDYVQDFALVDPHIGSVVRTLISRMQATQKLVTDKFIFTDMNIPTQIWILIPAEFNNISSFHCSTAHLRFAPHKD